MGGGGGYVPRFRPFQAHFLIVQSQEHGVAKYTTQERTHDARDVLFSYW